MNKMYYIKTILSFSLFPLADNWYLLILAPKLHYSATFYNNFVYSRYNKCDINIGAHHATCLKVQLRSPVLKSPYHGKKQISYFLKNEWLI